MSVRAAPGAPFPGSSTAEQRPPKPPIRVRLLAGVPAHRSLVAQWQSHGLISRRSQFDSDRDDQSNSRLTGMGIPAWFRTRCFPVRIRGRRPFQCYRDQVVRTGIMLTELGIAHDVQRQRAPGPAGALTLPIARCVPSESWHSSNTAVLAQSGRAAEIILRVEGSNPSSAPRC